MGFVRNAFLFSLAMFLAYIGAPYVARYGLSVRDVVSLAVAATFVVILGNLADQVDDLKGAMSAKPDSKAKTGAKADASTDGCPGHCCGCHKADDGP